MVKPEKKILGDDVLVKELEVEAKAPKRLPTPEYIESRRQAHLAKIKQGGK